MRYVWIAMIATMSSLAASAQDKPTLGFGGSGSDLKQQLVELEKYTADGRGDPFLSGIAVGYIEATFETIRGMELICPHPAVTARQLTAVVKKYLDDHPAELHNSKNILIIQALGAAFPCANEKP